MLPPFFRMVLKQMFLLGMKKYLHLIEQYQDSWKCNPPTIGIITVLKFSSNIVVLIFLISIVILFNYLKVIRLLILQYHIINLPSDINLVNLCFIN